MEKDILIVRTNSANLWWGIYGFCEKSGWEDLIIYNSENERLGAFCLNTKRYLRNGIEDLKDDPDEKDFVQAIDHYLADDQIHYWFYYSDPSSEDFSEVSYKAPKNATGIKPQFLDIWHPDEAITIRTIESSVKNFASVFLEMDEAEIKIEQGPAFEESLSSYQEHLKLTGNGTQVEIGFTDELVQELSVLWNRSEQEVLQILKKYSL